jgi:predicted transcriptional regulator
MHNPQRDPFFEGLWADIQEGIEAADRGDLFDLEDVARELRGESTTTAES